MKCRVCGSTSISIKNDIYGLDRYNNIVGGTHKFTVDAGQGKTWDSNGQRYRKVSLLDCYQNNWYNSLTALKNQHGVRMVTKQFGRCNSCGFNMNLNNGHAYTVKP